jgi:hypothetical protein
VAVAKPISSSVLDRRLKRRLDVPGRDAKRRIRPTGIDATFRTGTSGYPHDRGTVVLSQPVPRSSVTLRNLLIPPDDPVDARAGRAGYLSGESISTVTLTSRILASTLPRKPGGTSS